MSVYIFEENIDKMGGVERIVSLLANNLSSFYDVNVISLKKTKKEEFFDYKDTVKRIYIDEHNYLSGWHNNKNVLKKRIYSLYYRINNFFLKTKKKQIFNKINEKDILIFGRIQVAIKWMPYLKKNYKIIIRDANHYYCNNIKEKKIITELLCDYTNLLIVSSDESKKVYEKVLSKNRPLIKKIYNPLGIVPSNLYNYNEKKIVAVGRFDKQKAFDVLIKAFSNVHKKHADWRLEIVGCEKMYFTDLIKKLHLDEVVSFRGEEKDIKKALYNSSLYVMTSRYEGYANSLVEAISCGIPSISFNWLMGVEEIINNHQNGEIVFLKDRFKYADGIDNDDDIKNLSKTICYLIENKKIMDSYSKKGLEICKTRDKDKIIDCWKRELEAIKND